MRIFAAGLAVALCAVFLAGINAAQDKKDEKPKFTIPEVMKKAHGGGKDSLRAKFLAGTATADEKAELTSYYVALSLNTPKKGEADAWKKKTTAILEAYKSGDVKAFAKATDCGSCHKEFKGK